MENFEEKRNEYLMKLTANKETFEFIERTIDGIEDPAAKEDFKKLILNPSNEKELNIVEHYYTFTDDFNSMANGNLTITPFNKCPFANAMIKAVLAIKENSVMTDIIPELRKPEIMYSAIALSLYDIMDQLESYIALKTNCDEDYEFTEMLNKIGEIIHNVNILSSTDITNIRSYNDEYLDEWCSAINEFHEIYEKRIPKNKKATR